MTLPFTVTLNSDITTKNFTIMAVKDDTVESIYETLSLSASIDETQTKIQYVLSSGRSDIFIINTDGISYIAC